MSLTTYVRMVALLCFGGIAGAATMFLMPPGNRPYLLAAGAIIWMGLFAYVFVVAVVMKRVCCPLCGRQGTLGSPPSKSRRYTAFCCPECGWIKSTGFLRTTFAQMDDGGDLHSGSRRRPETDGSSPAARADSWRKPQVRQGLRLEMESGEVLENPSANEIAIAIAGMRQDGNAFAILSRAEMFYMQTSGDPKGGFDLEYQEGSTKEHFRAGGDPFTMQQIVPALQDYAAGGTAWKNRFQWKRIW